MRMLTAKVALLATLVAGISVGAETPSLEALGVQLRAMRDSAASGPARAACAADLRSLIGVHQDRLRAALGEPDFIDLVTGEWAYLLSSPRPPTVLGGGHPELHLQFDAARRVVDAQCHRAR